LLQQRVRSLPRDGISHHARRAVERHVSPRLPAIVAPFFKN
jgi:hypothetical protein